MLIENKYIENGLNFMCDLVEYISGIMSWRLGKRGKIFTQLLTAVHWQGWYMFSFILLYHSLAIMLIYHVRKSV